MLFDLSTYKRVTKDPTRIYNIPALVRLLILLLHTLQLTNAKECGKDIFIELHSF